MYIKKQISGWQQPETARYTCFQVFPNEKSGRRDLNPRPSPWQGDALPLSHFRMSGGQMAGLLGSQEAYTVESS